MSHLEQLQFYATPEHPCSYLDHRQAKTIFADPQQPLSLQDYSTLSELGFRRSGSHVYRPHCSHCKACISTRVVVDQFRPSRSQKRVLRNNQDIQIYNRLPNSDNEYYRLYQRYINQRHADGDMYPASREQFNDFLVESPFESRFVEFRLDQRLVAVSVVDRLDNGLSAIYTFFDPDTQPRSLGRLAILKLIQQTRAEGLDYLYLGYWVRNCQKMAYKTDYSPIQLLLDNCWVQFNDPRSSPTA